MTIAGTSGSLPEGLGQPQTVNLLPQDRQGISETGFPREAVHAFSLTPSFGGRQTSLSVKTFCSPVFSKINPEKH